MIVTLALIFFSTVSIAAEEKNGTAWTELYQKTFCSKDRLANTTKKRIVFCKDRIKPFTQLIFSWNAQRPAVGHFSFYVQVRNADTKQWGAWHHMSDWGDGTQFSYVSKSDGFSSHVHVRLEIEKGMTSDGFRIRVMPEKGATLSSVHGLFVAPSHFAEFKAESYAVNACALPSVCIRNVPSIAQFALDHQDNGRICSPVSCAMVTRYFTGEVIDPVDFAHKAYDTGLAVYGSWPFNTAHVYERSNGKVYFFVRRFNSFDELHTSLRHNMPVIVSVRGDLPGAYKAFPHGHLLVVVGWDKTTSHVLCKDPAADTSHGVFKRYKLEDFLRAWERSHRLVYVAQAVK